MITLVEDIPSEKAKEELRKDDKIGQVLKTSEEALVRLNETKKKKMQEIEGRTSSLSEFREK